MKEKSKTRKNSQGKDSPQTKNAEIPSNIAAMQQNTIASPSISALASGGLSSPTRLGIMGNMLPNGVSMINPLLSHNNVGVVHGSAPMFVNPTSIGASYLPGSLQVRTREDTEAETLQKINKGIKEIQGSTTAQEQKYNEIISLIGSLNKENKERENNAIADILEQLQRINSLLQKTSVVWRCYGCGEKLDTLNSIEQLQDYMKNFQNKNYKKCKTRRHHNQFIITNDDCIIFASAPILLASKNA